MRYRVQTQADTVVLHLEGRFTFQDHESFRKAYEPVLDMKGPLQCLELDLNQVTYLDSSALGMLLLLRDKAHALGIAVRLSVQAGFARQMLETVQFHTIFDMAQ